MKEAGPERVQTVGFHPTSNCRKRKLIYRVREQISDHFEMGQGEGMRWDG